MSDETTLNALRDELNTIAAIDVNELAERGSLGSVNFTMIKVLLNQTIRSVQRLVTLPLNELPAPTLDSLSNQVSSLKKALLQVWEFSIATTPEGVRTASHRDTIQDMARNKCDAFLNFLVPILPFLQLNDPGFKSILENAPETVNLLTTQIGSSVNDLTKRVDDKISSLDSALQVVRETAAQTGVTRHADAFKSASEAHSASSRRWLVATAVLAVLTITVAIVLLYEFPSFGELQDAAIIQKIVARLVIISILYFGVIWFIKNYRAHRHLSVLNSHRQNALETFESFVEGAGGDEQTKNAVLLEATHCIFSPANTGYLGADEENPTSRIVEILKTVGASSK